ncbi:guanine nucleotide-binding protein g(o) subunit alpha [Anaeramoeba flamelloides]|uniref:Guanine nucleotide-binding protein g(O) subunit alpha n=1 Tax=Anaeramoeba flamelloides TaxID=1746091 RepID=A0AAV7Y5U0_9EUKA|nr:guanine nucleotide-binding protein g(o) subunit alpha [Anaeramoeba flamelloides]
MKIIHGEGFNNRERIAFRNIIYRNVISDIKVLIENYYKFHSEPLQKQIETTIDEVSNLDFNIKIDKEISEKILTIWKNEKIQQIFQNYEKFNIPESSEYFFNKISEIDIDNYLPSDEDILLCRVQTTGVNQIKFESKGYNFTLIDVGGQRNERRKWINHFENILSVLFVTSLSEYNQKLYEDESINRMHESILLFEQISNNQYFHKSPIILFLNKVDLFKRKIAKYPLTIAFPNYTGGNTFEEASQYIEKKIKKKRKKSKSSIYCHYTCATNTKNVKFVFDAIQDIILQQILPQMGIL